MQNLIIQRSDKFDSIEKRIFNGLKYIPLLGWAYLVLRFVVFSLKRNFTEAVYCLTVDVPSIFNPLRALCQLIRHCNSTTKDQSKGFWIGKKPILSYFPIAATIGPGLDLFSWVVMIDGQIYQL